MVADARPAPSAVPVLNPAQAQALLARIAANVEKAVKGNPQVVKLALVALCGRGHLLLEGPPGVGKTSLAQSLARSLELSFSRVQFTSDLLPTDIVGATVFDPRSVRFEFRKGPIFANVVLADELNRAPPRVQSALLESLAEGQVSTESGPQPLPEPFFAIATQNPSESAGTFPLPDAALDRFGLRLGLAFPDRESERAVLLGRGLLEPWRELGPVARAGDVFALQAAAAAVRVSPALADYVISLAERSRAPGFAVRGLSTRASLWLLSAARAHALFEGRDHCLPDDVKAVAVASLAHRLVAPGGEGLEADRRESERLVQRLLAEVPVPV